MEDNTGLKGFSVKHAPLAKSARIFRLLLSGDYAEAERLTREEDEAREQAARRYVASLLEQQPGTPE